MWQPKNASLYPSCIVFSEFGRSFKSLADTSSEIQVTNIFILIHGYCLQAMYISLVNEASVSFWRKCVSYGLLKYEIIKLLLVYNQFYSKPKPNIRRFWLPFPSILCSSILLFLRTPMTILWINTSHGQINF